MKTPRFCLDCGQALQPLQRRGYCETCLPWHCQTCQVRMDRPRSGRRCTDCLRAMHAKTIAKERRCYQCQTIIAAGVKGSLCRPCGKEQYLFRRYLLQRTGERPCSQCGQSMPPGRYDPRCVDCRRRQRAKSYGGRPCAACGVKARRSYSCYCHGCRALYQNWLRAYHAGDPAAKAIKKKRSRRQWQENQP